ncbi:MAG: ABC transporter substrate-binding protein [Pseudolabrys sp.]|nr:ABC transporter substrate-binding protein [Pseudolabrys sp.]
MTDWTRRHVVKASGGFLGASLLPFGLGGPVFAQQKEFRIPVIASMTGPASPFFKEYVEGFKAYAKAWNERGGYKGRQIVLDIIDDESAAVPAANGYRKVAGDQNNTLVWVAGPGAGGLAIKAMAPELKLPIVSGGATDGLTEPPEPYFFKIAPVNRDYLTMYLEWCKAHGKKRLAFIVGNDTYGQGEVKTAKEVCPQLGLDIVAMETFSQTDTNFSSQLVRIRSANPDIVYAAGTGSPGILLYKQYRQLGLKYPICFMLAALTASFFNAIGGEKEADGVLTPGLLGMMGANAGGDSGRLYGDMEKALGRTGNLANALGWDIGIVTEYALGKSDGTRESIRAALDNVTDLPGIDGPITFNPKLHAGQDKRGLAMLKLQGGKFVRADG